MEDPSSDNWKACAKKGIRAQVIERCANGPAGKKILERNIQISEALRFNASPTWLANNKHTFSGISASAIQKAFCQHNPKLAGCKKILSESENSQGAQDDAPQCGGTE